MTKTLNHAMTRRRVLIALGVLGGAMAAADVMLTPPAYAEDVDIHKLPLLAYFQFDGGWDSLLSLDPRDHSQPQYSQPSNPIHTGYDLVAIADTEAANVMTASNNTGILTPNGSNIGFGLAMGRMADHYEDLCVIRGLSMGTVAHEVGRRYFLTGKYPRGLNAAGSSLSTWWASENPSLYTIPNIVIHTETYNEGLDPLASGLGVDGYQALSRVLRPLEPLLEPRPELVDALGKIQHRPGCLESQLDLTSLITSQRASYDQARALLASDAWKLFDFTSNPEPGGPVATLFAAFGIDPVSPFTQLSGGVGGAAIAAQALSNGISQSASIGVVRDLDTHGGVWATTQGALLRDGWNAIADFIAFMKSTLDPNGKPYWDRMTVIVGSEFARTPRINGRGGRDHHLYSSALIAGNGIKGNQVIGMTNESFLGVPIDHKTGQPNEGGAMIRPPDVHATVLKAAGLGYDNVSNQTPLLLETALKS